MKGTRQQSRNSTRVSGVTTLKMTILVLGLVIGKSDKLKLVTPERQGLGLGFYIPSS